VISSTRNENLVDLETDKVVLEVTAPESWRTQPILKENRRYRTGGELLAYWNLKPLKRTQSPENKYQPINAEQNGGKIFPLSPSVRRLIHENTLGSFAYKARGLS